MASSPETPSGNLPGEGRDDPGTPDLPLQSIPSVPEDPLAEEEPRRGGLGTVFAALGVLALIVSAALLGVRYVKLPRSAVDVAPPEEHPIESATQLGQSPAISPSSAFPALPEDAGTSPLSDTLPPYRSESANAADPPAERAPASSAPDELERTTRELAQARRALEQEQDARKSAERKLAEAHKAAPGRNAKAAQADGLDRRGRARLKKLEAEVATLKKSLAAARKEAEAARTSAEGSQEQIATSQAETDAAAKRARSIEAEMAASQARHQQALAGESAAVRKLVAELAQARKQAEAEKSARLAAERKVKELERAASGAERSAPAADLRTSPATPRSSSPVRTVSSTTVEPQRLSTPPPRYPEDLRRAGVAGRVTLKLLISSSGAVEDVKVESAPDPRLGQAAVEAARRWQYQPGRKDGLRSRMWITELVDFKL